VSKAKPEKVAVVTPAATDPDGVVSTAGGVLVVE
jgi:hypothetical protein